MPAGSTIANGDVSDAADLNSPLSDIESDANTPRPVVAGGTGASSASAALVNLGLTATAAEINVLDGVTATTAEINILDGVTATTAEINALDGVTATGTALIVAADAAAGRTAISAQAADATLTSLAGLSLVAGDVLYATGADTLVRLGAGTAGQVLTMNAGATAPEWTTVSTDVGAGTAALSAGAVGTYAFARRTTGTADVAFGATLAGSSLSPTSAFQNLTINSPGADTAVISLATGTALSGTWRCMGEYDHLSNTSFSTSGGGATLWLRIS